MIYKAVAVQTIDWVRLLAYGQSPVIMNTWPAATGPPSPPHTHAYLEGDVVDGEHGARSMQAA
jgi:hypothetical protein